MTNTISMTKRKTQLEIFAEATSEANNLINSILKERRDLFTSSELTNASTRLKAAYNSLQEEERIVNSLRHGAYQLKISIVKNYLQGAERN